MAWPGGKDGAGVAQRLINQIPPHTTFISAFLGDCAILRRKRPADVNIGIDVSRDNVERWRDVNAICTRKIEPLELYCCDSIEWLRHRFGWYQVAGSGGDGSRGNLAGTLDRATRDPAAAAAVAGNGDDADGTFVYCDPPYMLDTRRSAKRLYAHELSDAQHVELLNTVVTLPCLVMVSHYPCSLYDHSLRDWRSFTFDAQTRGGARATEKVWCNYPPPEKLHDARFLGLNKRQRERVRRRVKNWTAGLARMEPLERQAVLDAIVGR